MPSSINSTSSSPGGLITTGATDNELVIQTDDTTAISIDASQNVTVAGDLTVNGTIVGGGDVVGPASSTDNAITRFDSTTGKLIQNSSATLDDTGAPTFVGSVNVSGTSSSASYVRLYEDTDNGTNYVDLIAPTAITANSTITFPNGTGTVAVNGVSTNIVSVAIQASTSGTEIDFTGIPSWVKRITVMFDSVSVNSTSNLLCQIGDSGGFETSGYSSVSFGGSVGGSNIAGATSTAGFIITRANAAAYIWHGAFMIQKFDGNEWSQFGVNNGTSYAASSSGIKTLDDTLDRVRITTVLGTNTFDSGNISLIYE